MFIPLIKIKKKNYWTLKFSYLNYKTSEDLQKTWIYFSILNVKKPNEIWEIICEAISNLWNTFLDVFVNPLEDYYLLFTKDQWDSRLKLYFFLYYVLLVFVLTIVADWNNSNFDNYLWAEAVLLDFTLHDMLALFLHYGMVEDSVLNELFYSVPFFFSPMICGYYILRACTCTELPKKY